MNSKNRTALLALAAALPLTAGLVFAQTTSAQPQRVQPAQPGQSQNNTQPGIGTPNRQTSATNYADTFLQRLAAGLGVSVDRLKSAAVTAGNATIDQAVRNGDLSQDRAAALKARLQDAPLNFGRFGGTRGSEGGPDRQRSQTQDRGPRAGFGQAVVSAVARSLGLSEQALAQQLQQGQTVRQIAQARGVSTTTVRNAAVSALRTSLAAEVQAGRLSQAQAQQLLARAQADENFGLNFGRGGRGGSGRDGQGGPRGFDQPTTPGTQGS